MDADLRIDAIDELVRFSLLLDTKVANGWETDELYSLAGSSYQHRGKFYVQEKTIRESRSRHQTRNLFRLRLWDFDLTA